MTVILINPNRTAAMTDSALAAARAAAPEIRFEGWTSEFGPDAIEGVADGERAVPPLLDLVRAASEDGATAIIIACFDDTGLSEARRLARCPVIGIGQASYIMASLLPGPAAVITTVEAAVPVIQANIEAHGYDRTIIDVVAARVPVLTLEHDPDTAASQFIATAGALGADVSTIILGCAGAVKISDVVARSVPYPVLDGVTAAARLSRVLAT